MRAQLIAEDWAVRLFAYKENKTAMLPVMVQ